MPNLHVVKFHDREVEFDIDSANNILSQFESLSNDEKVQLLTMGINPYLARKDHRYRPAVRVHYKEGIIEHYCISDAADELGINKANVLAAINRGMDPLREHPNILKIELIHHLTTSRIMRPEHVSRLVEVTYQDGTVEVFNSFIEAERRIGFFGSTLYESYLRDDSSVATGGIIKEIRLLGPTSPKYNNGRHKHSYLKFYGGRKIYEFNALSELRDFLLEQGHCNITLRGVQNKIERGGAIVYPGIGQYGYMVSIDKEELLSNITPTYYAYEDNKCAGPAKFVLETPEGKFYLYRNYMKLAKMFGVQKSIIRAIRTMAVFGEYRVHHIDAWVKHTTIKERKIEKST